MKNVTKVHMHLLVSSLLAFVFPHDHMKFSVSMMILPPKLSSFIFSSSLSSTALHFSASSSPQLSSDNKHQQQQKNHHHHQQNQSTKKVRTQPLPWITCVTAIELQRAIQTFVRPEDHVLELGSLLGDTTNVLCQQIGPKGKATLVDIERKEPTSGRSKGRDPSKFRVDVISSEKNDINANVGNNDDSFNEVEGEEGLYTDRVQFVEIQHFEEWRRVLYQNEQNSSFDVVVIDMGAIIGNDLALTAISVIQEIVGHQKLSPNTNNHENENENEKKENAANHSLRAIIIKSTALSSLSHRLIHAQKLVDGLATLHFDEDSSSVYKDPYLVATVGVDQYRKTIPYVVRQNDSVLEVGCHFGTSTVKIHQAAAAGPESTTPFSSSSDKGFCIGVDIGPKCIQVAKQNYPHVPFNVGDAWRTADLARLPYVLGVKKQPQLDRTTNGNINMVVRDAIYDVIYADIGGLSGPDGLLESLSLLEGLSKALEPRCIVIKSLCMRRLSSSLRPFSEIWSNMKKKEREKKDKD